MQDLLYSMKKEMLRRKYSYKTISSYIYCVKKFLNKHNHKELKKINKGDITDYLERFDCGNTINVYLSAIKFFFKEMLKKKLTINIKYSKTAKKLPDFLTKNEIVRLFNNIKNKKHKLLVELMYSAGLRVGELVKLRIKDFEFDHGYGFVRKGKGNKDRLFIIANNLKDDIIDFIKENNLEYGDYLFNGYKTHLSIRSVQEILKIARRKSGIIKNIHPHMLRHSFATHLVENGYSVEKIQPLLGHEKIDTTLIYTPVCPKIISVKSPFDNL